jgi:hypothetical protein
LRRCTAQGPWRYESSISGKKQCSGSCLAAIPLDLHPPDIVHSRPVTPVPGLNDDNVRSLVKGFDIGAKLIELFMKIIQKVTGEEVNELEVVEILDTYLDDEVRVLISFTNETLKTDSRTFSVLQPKDNYLLVPGGAVGSINYDKTRNPIVVEDKFFTTLQDLIPIVDRTAEGGCRVIIAFYLVSAIKLVRKMFELPRLLLSSERALSAEYIPELGNLSGVLDFSVATVKGEQRKPLGTFPFLSFFFRSRDERSWRI